MITLMIIDDHPLVIDGIKTMVSDIASIRVIGSARSAEEGLQLLECFPETDLILTDINLPGMDGLDFCATVRQRNRKIKIIGLSYINEAGITTQLLKRGADGFLLKNMERDELLQALNTVMNGKTYVSPAANEKILQQIRKIDSTQSQIPLLTRREKEIIEFLERGLKSSEIAEKLFLSVHTVDTHRKNMLQKFNVHNVQSLLNRVKELGIF